MMNLVTSQPTAKRTTPGRISERVIVVTLFSASDEG